MFTLIQNQAFENLDRDPNRSMEDSVFLRCSFRNLNAEGINLSCCHFIDCTFADVDFYWAILYSSTYVNCRFSKVDFRGASSQHTIFNDCVFDACDFGRDNLGAETILDETLFIDCQNPPTSTSGT